MSTNHLSDLRFDTLTLADSVQAGIRDAGFEFCTPIQASTYPGRLRIKSLSTTVLTEDCRIAVSSCSSALSSR